jgi:hypothetical protein
MFAAIDARGFPSPLGAIALALALGAAGCSADLGRFDLDPPLRSMQADQRANGPFASSWAGTLPGFAATPEVRPRADIPGAGSPTAPVGRHNSAVRITAPEERPIRRLRGHSRAMPGQGDANAVRKNQAKLRRGRVTKQRSAARTTASRPGGGAGAPPAIFHWPAHGEIVARFGRQADGRDNSGIDIAVPEHTPIKSAGDGVVIYAGSGLKSFGNLVLVRHADNYFTAYVNANELVVIRGDQVNRGGIIGRSGQTGNASTPRLHFEIRKNSAPVDPIPLLKGSNEAM